MGNIGTPEILIVLIVALLVLGPTRLPQAARQVGKAMAEFRRVTGGLQAEMRDAMSSIETEIKSAVDVKDEPPTTPPAKPYVFEPPAAIVAAAPDSDAEPTPDPLGAGPLSLGVDPVMPPLDAGMISPPPEAIGVPSESAGEASEMPKPAPEGDAPVEG